jgi:hypothetical protein
VYCPLYPIVFPVTLQPCVRAMSWTCFHCEETFTEESAARAHFGAHEGYVPGCLERLPLGEASLLERLREAQAEVERLRHDINEDLSCTRAYHAHLASDIRAFRPFRECRSLQDVFNVYDSMEGRALAAEERACLPSMEADERDAALAAHTDRAL